MSQMPNDAERERAKHEQLERDVDWRSGLKPGNPYVFRMYPKMLYRAQQMRNGKWSVSEGEPSKYAFVDPNQWERAREEVLAFNKSCQFIVNSEMEHIRMRENGEGWRDSMGEAMEHRAALNDAISDAAATSNWEERLMSDKAKAERETFNAENFGHHPEMPERAKRKYVRKAANPEA